MFARNVVAMIAMLPWSPVPCLAAVREVGVFLRSDGGASSNVIEALRTEVDGVMQHAGFRVKWKIGQSTAPFEAEDLIVVDFRGVCSVPVVQPSRRISQLELASTAVADSQILPFTSLDCATLNNLLHTSLARAQGEQREFLYGRALARVLAHEFYHVLVRTPKHTARGVAKKSHSADDLLAAHFDFDPVALANLRQVSQASMQAAKNQTGPESAPSEAPAEPALDNPVIRQ